MATYNYELSAINESVRFGNFTDHKILADNGNFKVQENSSTDYINLSVDAPTANNHAVPRRSLLETKYKTVHFKEQEITHSTSSEVLVWQIPGSATLIGIKAYVNQIFNGTNPQVRVVSDVNSDVLWDWNIANLKSVGVYSTTEFYQQDLDEIPQPDQWIRIAFQSDSSTQGIVKFVFEYIYEDFEEA